MNEGILETPKQFKKKNSKQLLSSKSKYKRPLSGVHQSHEEF